MKYCPTGATGAGQTPRVNLSALKKFACGLSRRSALRTVLLSERDELSPSEFLAKLEVWLALLRHEEGALE
jgi:hypothetical protein